MLLVRLRSTGNWIWFDSGYVWIYWDKASGKCLRITRVFVPAHVSLRSLLKRFTQFLRESGFADLGDDLWKVSSYSALCLVRGGYTHCVSLRRLQR